MRHALATVLGALALTGALSIPAHANGPTPDPVTGVLGIPLKANSAIGPLHIGQLPLFELPRN
ncbi:hypothetical protein AB0D04_00635 [Streptomyces sp. NPDC048483]|uniref:hypothetical protein n=1 Tax=Streptomyces sp. NPDC048483 TaxID=3154927 RepID=UPI003415E03C